MLFDDKIRVNESIAFEFALSFDFDFRCILSVSVDGKWVITYRKDSFQELY